ncbi:hypothetical protein [Microbacterium sp. SLBN-146]|uniref:hypothetical protein n=1 Tax=Microbacterium sp. SLBN-146 TaxID=2768457 RepID=UPI00115242DB|nr:hypothetical protein [Microbacterium sp. SLBN-146]TQJ30599.1 hypothetical protein FBY39_1052 [Microbacterium sp. SLBN-146]
MTDPTPPRAAPRIAISEISGEHVAEVADFLHRELNPAVSSAAWATLLDPPWGAPGPNRGFLLRADGEIVGAYAAVYSSRNTATGTVDVCNLAAFCVQESFRMHSLRLVRALLKQKGLLFTDLSPSGNVVAMNERLGFSRIPATAKLAVNLPLSFASVSVSVSVSDDPARIASTLRGRDAVVYRDHASAPAARHVVVTKGDDYAYVMYRVDRRKRLRLFASPLFTGGDRTLLERSWGAVGAHFARRGLPFTLMDSHALGFEPHRGRVLKNPRVKMFRGDHGTADAVDYLYSELALVEW